MDAKTGVDADVFFHFNLNNITPPLVSVQTLQLRQDLSDANTT